MKSLMLVAAALASAFMVTPSIFSSLLIACDCCRPRQRQTRQDGKARILCIQWHHHIQWQKLRVRFYYHIIPYLYRELVTKNPRPYDVVIIYSVSTQCDQCDEVFSEYSSVVYSFLQNKDKVKRPVFFGAMYYSKDNHKFFLQHGFKTVPHLTVSLQKA